MLWKKNKCSLKEHLPPPFTSAHQLYSMIFTEHDAPSRASSSLMQLSIQAIQEACTLDLNDLCKRLKKPPYYPNVWPGEHYKLLAGFVRILKPKLIVEIGTASGLSALALKKFLPASSKIATFDLFSWETDTNTVLQKEDFQDGGLLQYVTDLSDDKTFLGYKDLLQEADLFFIDATHDGNLEKNLMKKFSSLQFRKTPYFILDDIRMWGMLKMWREIAMPKLDLTSFGHWSGTGIIEGTQPYSKHLGKLSE